VSVSIVLPAYNAAKFITHTVDSVQRQTGVDWELVAVDDGSSDETPAILAEYARHDSRIQFYRTTNGGESAARNFGFARCTPKHEMIIFLDHDDVWLPGALSTLTGELASNSIAAGAYGLASMIDAQGQPTMPGFLEAWGRNRKKLVGRRLAPCAATDATHLSGLVCHLSIATMGLCVLWRHLLPNDPFPVAMRTGGADYYLYLKLAQGRVFHFVDQVLILKRQHETNITANHDASQLASECAVNRAWSEATDECRRVMEMTYGIKWRAAMAHHVRCAIGGIRRCSGAAIVEHASRLHSLTRKRTIQRLGLC
jgi:glycosyltransferase involved in cell wall biosynthesis